MGGPFSAAYAKTPAGSISARKAMEIDGFPLFWVDANMFTVQRPLSSILVHGCSHAGSGTPTKSKLLNVINAQSFKPMNPGSDGWNGFEWYKFSIFGPRHGGLLRWFVDAGRPFMVDIV